MPNLNSVTLIGHMCRDPEIKRLNNFTVCQVSIAVNNPKKVNDQWVDDPTFLDVKCFDKKAEVLFAQGTKGAPMAVSGKLKTERWKGKDGSDKQKLVLVADQVLVGMRYEPGDETPTHTQRGGKNEPPHDRARQQETAGGPTGDDIPF